MREVDLRGAAMGTWFHYWNVPSFGPIAQWAELSWPWTQRTIGFSNGMKRSLLAFKGWTLGIGDTSVVNEKHVTLSGS